MKKQSKNIRSGTLRDYIFSYVGILLLTLSILSCFWLWHLAKNLEEEELRITRSKLYTIGEDVEAQTTIMRRTALEIESMQKFRFQSFQGSKYLEIELLDHLKDYRRDGDIGSTYFLSYLQTDTIFTSAGTTVKLRDYLQAKFEEAECDKIERLIKECCVSPNNKLVLHKAEKTTLFLYPLKADKNAVLCFLATEQAIQSRIQRLVGDLGGTMGIYYNDTCILGEASGYTDTALHAQSQSGNVTLYYDWDETYQISFDSLFSGRELVIVAVVMILLLGTGCVLAYRNYLPMGRIVKKYQNTTEDQISADWDSIDQLIEGLLHEKEEDHRRYQTQYRLLRASAIRMLVADGFSESVQPQTTLLNIHLDAAVYGVICCSGVDARINELFDTLCGDIENLSDDDMILYPYRDHADTLCVLVAAGEEYQVADAADLLQSLLEAKMLGGTAVIMDISKDLSQLRGGTVQTKRIGEEVLENPGHKKNTERQNIIAQQAVQYIQENCTEYNLSLDLIAQKHQITSTYLCRLIRNYMGMGYKEYLVQLRMEAAKKMLAQSNDSVANICVKTGYNNVSHFIKVFQKYTGVTPAKYRENEKNMYG